MSSEIKLGLAAGGTVALAVSFLVCAVVRRVAPNIGLLDRPGERKIHSSPVPVGGGIGIWCGVLFSLTLLFAAAFSSVHFDVVSLRTLFSGHAEGILASGTRLVPLLGMASVLFLLGTLDDRYNIDWKIRIAVEFLIAALAVFQGWEATFFINIPIAAKILSVLWIVTLTNSFNLLDNMDGLSSGVAMICASFLAAVLLFCSANANSGEPQLFLGGFLVVMIGAIAGFWFHNMPKARLFMGDGGAYFIGFLLATITLSATFAGNGNPSRSVLAPFCIFAVPLYDTLSVIFIRLVHRKSPFVGDTNHYSHRLVAIGLSKTGSVLTIYLTSAICGIGAVFLFQVNRICAVLVGCQIVMVLLLNAILEFTARCKINEIRKEETTKDLSV